MNSALPRLVVTLGDPAGIGPEVVLKAIAVFGKDCLLVYKYICVYQCPQKKVDLRPTPSIFL